MSMNFGPEWMRKAPTSSNKPSSQESTSLSSEPPKVKSAWASGRPSFKPTPASDAPVAASSAPSASKPAVTSFSDVAKSSSKKPDTAAITRDSHKKKHVYSRETMLNLFDETLPAPEGFDMSLIAYVAEARQPLAYLPLSDHEKKVFSMSSINSEPGKRQHHPRQGNHQERGPGGHRSHNYGHRQGYNNSNNSSNTNTGGQNNERVDSAEWKEGRPSQTESDAAKDPEDLWDTPTTVGSFGNNGVFGFANLPSDLLDKKAPSVSSTPVASKEPPEPVKAEVSPPKTSPQQLTPASVANVPNPPVQATPPAKPFEIGPQKPTSSPITKPSSVLPSSQPGFSAILGSSPLLESESLLGRGRGLPSLVGQTEPSLGGFQDPLLFGGPTQQRLQSQQPLFPTQPQQPPSIFPIGAGGVLGGPQMPPPPVDALNIPPFKFVPPQWVYRDPSGNVQGPFSSETMHTWYKEGYFPAGLPIKCVDDQVYIPLFQFIEKYGTEAPFLESLVEQEQLERMYYMQQVQKMRMANMNPLGGLPQPFGMPPMHGFMSPQQQQHLQQQSGLPVNFGGMNSSLLGGGGTGIGMPLSSSLANPVVDLLPRKIDPEAVIATSSAIHETQPAAQVEAPKSPKKQPASPIKSKKSAASPILPAASMPSPKPPSADILAAQMNDLSVADKNDTIPEVTESQVPESRSAHKRSKSPSKKADGSGEKTTKSGGKKDKKASPVESAVQETSSAVVEESSHFEEESNNGWGAPPVVATPPAPWLNKESKRASKMSLREIQEAEAKRAAQLEKERQLKAQEALKLEATRLAQAAASANQPAIAAQSSWGTGALAASGKQKTLTEIMEDEAKSKQSAEKQAKAAGNSGVKRYSDKVGAAVSRPTGFAAAAASGTSSSPSAAISVPSGWGTRAPAVVATGPLLKPSLVSTIGQSNNTQGDAGWQTVGKNTVKPSSVKQEAPSPVSNPVIASIPKAPAPSVPATPTSRLIAWARSYLKSIQRSGSAPLNVDEFIGILMSFPVKESSTITMICDDTLGGFTAVDPRKFADEFMRRRTQEGLNAAKPGVLSSSEVSKPPSVKPASTASTTLSASAFGPPDLSHYADDNRFTVVQSSKKKKNKKK